MNTENFKISWTTNQGYKYFVSAKHKQKTEVASNEAQVTYHGSSVNPHWNFYKWIFQYYHRTDKITNSICWIMRRTQNGLPNGTKPAENIIIKSSKRVENNDINGITNTQRNIAKSIYP